MDTESGNADWADGAHGFVHLSPPGVGRVSMLKGRRADERGGKWLELEAGGSSLHPRKRMKSVYCACNHA